MIAVDTNVVSELMRPAPDPRVAGWVRSQPGRELYTTSITLAEVRYGIERLAEGHRKAKLRSTAEEVFASFEEHVLPFDAVAAVQYAVVANAREQAGAPIDGFDAQIASVCRVYEAALATRNGRDFEDTGVVIIDPWSHD